MSIWDPNHGDDSCNHTDWHTIWYRLTREEISKLLEFIESGKVEEIKK